MSKDVRSECARSCLSEQVHETDVIQAACGDGLGCKYICGYGSKQVVKDSCRLLRAQV